MQFNGNSTVNSKSGRRQMNVDQENDSITIASKGDIGMTLLRFSTEDSPRFSAQWHTNSSILNGSNPVVHFAVRILGLFEANAENPLSLKGSLGTSYAFREFAWSNFVVFNTTDSATNITRYGITTVGNSNNVPGRNPISVNLTAWYAADSFKTSDGAFTPTGIKYSINITGTPNMKLTNSTWKLVKMVYSNRKAASTLNSTAVGDGVGSLNWDSGIVVDGVNSTIAYESTLNTTSLNSDVNFTASVKRDARLDERCGKKIVVWTIPAFNSSFFWDPVASVDETAASAGTISSAPMMALFATAVTALCLY
jgi:hypothetical protein